MAGAEYLSCGLKANKEVIVSAPFLDHVFIREHVFKRASGMGKLLKAVAIAASDESTATNQRNTSINVDGISLIDVFYYL